VTTSGSAVVSPRWFPEVRFPTRGHREITALLFALFACWLCVEIRRRLAAQNKPRRIALSIMCFALALAGCGGGGSSAPQPPQVVTPTGTYTITITPTATPTGSGKNLALNPISLTLIVK
jgi:hypothetical protein